MLLVEFAVLFEKFSVDVGIDVHHAVTESWSNAGSFALGSCYLLKILQRMNLLVCQQGQMLRQQGMRHRLRPHYIKLVGCECVCAESNAA